MPQGQTTRMLAFLAGRRQMPWAHNPRQLMELGVSTQPKWQGKLWASRHVR
jgi:hypothetical protein